MAKNERRMVRKPATKFPNLRKKLQKEKVQSKLVKRKRGREGAATQGSATIKVFPSPGKRATPNSF